MAVATLSKGGVRVISTAASMRRGQSNGFWEAQRSQLEARLHAKEESSCVQLDFHAIATRLRSLLASHDWARVLVFVGSQACYL